MNKVFPELIKDIEARNQLGMKTYHRPLTTFNGRNALLDVYEEMLDACVYLKQRLMEEALIERPLQLQERMDGKCVRGGDVLRIWRASLSLSWHTVVRYTATRLRGRSR
jgi:hypothetical protein